MPFVRSLRSLFPVLQAKCKKDLTQRIGLHMELKNVKKTMEMAPIPTYQLANIDKVSICHTGNRLGREGR